jgi:hypothetical protein
MKKRFGTYVVITIQLATLLALQFNMVAPHVARLFPALLAGDPEECHCSLESRRNGTSCCKQASKLKLKMHCRSAAARPRPVSFHRCPCNDTSHITFVSLENPIYLGFFAEPPIPGRHPGLELYIREPQKPQDKLLDPPDPPPRLFTLS